MQWTDRIGRRVRLRDLHILLAVVQAGSMARAADRLAISNPVVSKTISDLEHALGVRLLDRTSQGVEPTAYGRAFLNCGTAVFDELRRGVQAIEFLSDPTVGEVRIGATGPLIDGFIPSVIDQLSARYPRMKFHALEGASPVLSAMMRERKIDVAVSRTWGLAFGDDFDGELLFDEHLYVVAGPQSRWARRRRIDIAELLDEPWVMPELDNSVGSLIVKGFRSAGLDMPAAQVTANSMAVRTRMVLAGRHLTMLPSSMLHFGAHQQLKVLPVKLPMDSEPVEIISLKNRTPNPIVSLLINELRSTARILTSGRPRRKKTPVKSAR
jgi:DNA-binding transcriptional LysR family regulator